MRNFSDRNCTENQNTRFMFIDFFYKIMPFLRLYGKILYSQTGHIWE